MSSLANPYEKFAYAYDRIMYNVDYQRWADYIQSIFNQQGESPRTILDVACGTATLTLVLSERSFQMTGIDLAEGMITIAREKASNLGLKVELAHGDKAP